MAAEVVDLTVAEQHAGGSGSALSNRLRKQRVELLNEAKRGCLIDTDGRIAEFSFGILATTPDEVLGAVFLDAQRRFMFYIEENWSKLTPPDFRDMVVKAALSTSGLRPRSAVLFFGHPMGINTDEWTAAKAAIESERPFAEPTFNVLSALHIDPIDAYRVCGYAVHSFRQRERLLKIEQEPDRKATTETGISPALPLDVQRSLAWLRKL